MEYAFARNSIVAAVVVAVAIGGVVVALAADRSTGPVDINQGVKGKADTTTPDPASEFRRDFKAAATATKRRDLVMKACEDGLIRSRMGLEDLKKLFGDSPMFTVYPLDKKTGNQSALLEFAPLDPLPPAGGGIIAHPRYHGWFMRFFFEHDDLKLYYLTYGK
jgi:hypothetical protein